MDDAGAAAGVWLGFVLVVVLGAVVVGRVDLEIPVQARVGIGAVFSGQVRDLAFWCCRFSWVVVVVAVVRARAHTRTAQVVP